MVDFLTSFIHLVFQMNKMGLFKNLEEPTWLLLFGNQLFQKN
jgi:hypothetical protein